MSDEHGVIGDEPLVDGMYISLRYRRDFRVADAERLLAAARASYLERVPDSTPEAAEQAISCATEAVYEMLESAGILGGAADAELIARQDDGLQIQGWMAQLVLDESRPLNPGPLGNCLRGDEDIFALPPGERGFADPSDT